MWGLIRKDLGEFVSTLKDDATVTIKSAMALGEGEEEYESVRKGRALWSLCALAACWIRVSCIAVPIAQRLREEGAWEVVVFDERTAAAVVEVSLPASPAVTKACNLATKEDRCTICRSVDVWCAWRKCGG